MTLMAIIETSNMPAVMYLGSGRLGKGVVCDRKTTKYIRVSYRESKPPCAKQQAQYDKYRKAEDSYNSMSADERKAWYALQIDKSYSAYHKWMKIHLKKGGPYG